MKAVQFTQSIPRYLLCKAAGRFIPGMCWSHLSCLRYGEVPEPPLPTERWVKIRVRFGGICGSDLNLIRLHDSPALSPFASFPFVVGHEAVGTVAAVGAAAPHLAPGQRVVVDPMLACVSRGFTAPCPACRRGDFSLCERMTVGDVAAGLLIGGCRDTGGSWSPYLVAHADQVLPLPDAVDDLNAVLVDPFACALHGVLRLPPRPGDTVLVVGAGVVGLCTVAALRALGYRNRVLVLAKHRRQVELAARFGATEVVPLSRRSYADLAQALGARLLRPMLGPPVLQGGADLIYECVGTDASLDMTLRCARGGGRVLLLGLAGVTRHVDWTPVWLKELAVQGSFAVGSEAREGGRLRTYQLALDLLRTGRPDLRPLVTHRFPLHRYREAIATAMGRGRERAIKVLLEP